MDDQSGAPPDSEIVTLLEQGEKADALTALERLSMAGAADQQACLRSLKAAADDQPKLFDGVLTSLTVFLQNSERPTRLTTAKLFVTVSESAPDSVVPVVPTLAERLADESEFYYVRARCAEALATSPSTIPMPSSHLRSWQTCASAWSSTNQKLGRN